MKKLLVLLLILLPLSARSAELLYNLQDIAASTAVVEANGGTSGTIVGGENASGMTVAGPGGVLTAALEFDGNDYITLPNFTCDNYTVCAWAGSWTAAADKSIFAADNFSASPRDFFVFKSASGTQYQWAATHNGTWAASSVTAYGGFAAYHHYMIVKSGSSAQLYIDNVATGSALTVGTGSRTYQNLRIAAHHFSGSTSEIATVRMAGYRIVDSALDSTQRAAEYARGVNSSTVPVIQFNDSIHRR